MIKRVLAFLAVCLLSTPLIAAPAGVTVNGVDVSEGSGEGWSYANSVLKLTSAGPFVLSGSTKNADGSVRVKVASEASVVMSNLVLYATKSACAFELSANVDLDLELAGTNVLKSGAGYAGLRVPAGASLTLGRRSVLAATLEVRGGSSGGAGIGGQTSSAVGRIRILGGQIQAVGGSSGGAGIGGARGRAADEIVIEGGTVFATGGDEANAIGGGRGSASGAHVTILGGSVHADRIRDTPTNAVGQVLQCVTVPELEPHAAVTVMGLDGYGTDGIVADENGMIYLWLPGTDSESVTYRFSANGTRYEATVRGVATTAVVAGHLEPTGVFVDGEDVGLAESGAGWSYSVSGHEIALTGAGPFVVSGTNTAESLEIGSAVGSQVKFLDFASGKLSLKGPLEIVGGTVAAQTMRGPITITGGSVACASFEQVPSNGMERVWCVTVTNLVPGSVVRPSGLTGYGVDGIVADVAGRIYLWLPNGDRIFTVDGRSLRAIVDEADVFAEPVPDVVPTGVTVNGIDAAYGHGGGWAYAHPTLTLSEEGPFTLSGTNELGAVQVAVRANATVVASNLVLTTTTGSPVGVAASSQSHLILSGECSFRSEDKLSPGLHVPAGAEIRIGSRFGECGVLSVFGGRYAAGIGGGDEEDAGTIEILGGTVVAVMGGRGDADIGGGADGAGATVTITGGSIKAETIANAPVNAAGQVVWCVTVTNLVPGSVVRPSGLTGYGVDGIMADVEGKIYLWLPDGEHAFTANGLRYAATVAGTAVTATCVGPAAVSPSRLEVTSIEVADGVARLGLATDLGAEDFAAWLESAVFEVDFRVEPAGEVVQTLIPARAGAVLSVALPPNASHGFLTVRAR